MADKQGDHALAGAMSAQADLIKGSANRKLWNSSLGEETTLYHAVSF